MEIIFVRHGESEANLLELMYGSSDYGLTDKGRTQAKKAGEILSSMGYHPDRIIVSSLKRTHETLESMGFSVGEAFRDSRLDERHLGDLEGLEFRHIHKEYPNLFKEWNEDWLHYKPGGGESHLEFQTRVRSFLTELLDSHEDGEKILAVCHGGTMKTIFSEIFQYEEEHFFTLEVYNCSLMRFRKGEKGLIFDALYNVDDFVQRGVENP